MGFFSELADMAEYMMFGERSRSAARMRANRAELDRQNREMFEREQAAKQDKPQGGERKTVQRNGSSGARRRVPRGSREDRNPRTNPDFGNGEVGGDNRWTSPVYGQTADGQDVTVSFRQDGQTGIASGHVSGAQYYRDDKTGHDHFGPNGEPFGDRGAYED